MNEEITKYDDIINLPHHISKKHKKMSIESRAAQFAPFAALTGFSDEIEETARITEEEIEINEELKTEINKKLQKIKENIKKQPQIICTYFVPDEKKLGGEYKKIIGNVKKIDEFNKILILVTGEEIPIKNLTEIDM